MNEHRQESTVWAADLLGLFARSLRRCGGCVWC